MKFLFFSFFLGVGQICPLGKEMKTFRDKRGEYRNIFMHFVFHCRDKERKSKHEKGTNDNKTEVGLSSIEKMESKLKKPKQRDSNVKKNGRGN